MITNINLKLIFVPARLFISYYKVFISHISGEKTKKKKSALIKKKLDKIASLTVCDAIDTIKHSVGCDLSARHPWG